MKIFLFAVGLALAGRPLLAASEAAPVLGDAYGHALDMAREPRTIEPLDPEPLKAYLRHWSNEISKDARDRAAKRQRALETYARKFEEVVRSATMGRAGTMEVLGLYGQVHGFTEQGHGWYSEENPLQDVKNTAELQEISDGIVDWLAANREAVIRYFEKPVSTPVDSVTLGGERFSTADRGEMTTVYQENVPYTVRTCEPRSSGGSSGGPSLLDILILYHIFK